jgi:hypothetical protein
MTEEKKHPEQEHNAGIDMLPEIEPETYPGTTIDEIDAYHTGRDGWIESRIERRPSGP